MAVESQRALKALSWLELGAAAFLVYPLARSARELFWPSDQNPAHGEWLGLVVPVLILLCALLALPATAALRSWPNPWWWQLLAGGAVVCVVLIILL